MRVPFLRQLCSYIILRGNLTNEPLGSIYSWRDGRINLETYASPRVCWIVKHHGLFQKYYYAHYYGEDRDVRDRYIDHPWYQDCAEFCEKYGQNCFDPDFESLPVSFFEPMVRNIFARPRMLEEI